MTKSKTVGSFISPKRLRELVAADLQAHGYDALWWDNYGEGCGCRIGDLMPCIGGLDDIENDTGCQYGWWDYEAGVAWPATELEKEKTMSNHVDKDKLLEDMNESHWEIVNAYANRIQSGMYDVEEPTVPLEDGNVAKVGDKVITRFSGEAAAMTITATDGERMILSDGAGRYKFGVGVFCERYEEPDTWAKLEADCNDPDWLAEWSPEVNPLHLATDILDRAKKLARVK
jgi:hypothetical protein